MPVQIADFSISMLGASLQTGRLPLQYTLAFDYHRLHFNTICRFSPVPSLPSFFSIYRLRQPTNLLLLSPPMLLATYGHSSLGAHRRRGDLHGPFSDGCRLRMVFFPMPNMVYTMFSGQHMPHRCATQQFLWSGCGKAALLIVTKRTA